MPTGRLRKCACPCASETCVCETGPVRSTIAPGTRAPLESSIAMSTRPVNICARAGAASPQTMVSAAAAAANLFQRVMFSNPSTDAVHDSPDRTGAGVSAAGQRFLHILFQLRVDLEARLL